MSPEEKIISLIEKKGGITFADFMDIAMFWPRGGYYAAETHGEYQGTITLARWYTLHFRPCYVYSYFRCGTYFIALTLSMLLNLDSATVCLEREY